MSNPKLFVSRVRFANRVKLGGTELEFWAADRHPEIACEATGAGLVFTPKRPAITPPGPPSDNEAPEAVFVDTVVPWPNVVSYDRSR